MWSPTRGLLRGLRATSLGLVGFVLALVAHVAAGGFAPGPAVMLLLAGLISLAAVLLTGGRLSPVRVTASLTVMQVVLHEAFMRLGVAPACLMTGASSAHRGYLGHVHLSHGYLSHGYLSHLEHVGLGQPLLGCATGVAQPGMGQQSVFAMTAMVGAHVAATAVMAALLIYGEQVLWLLTDCVRTPRWLRVGLPELPSLRGVQENAPRMARLLISCGGVSQRGPPTWRSSALV